MPPDRQAKKRQIIAEVDWGSAFATIYPKAIYLVEGRLFQVERFDFEGRKAYVLTLSTREQHIRRAGASSNVCTNQTLIAVLCAIQLSWLGTSGLRELALRCARGTRYAREALLAVVEQLRRQPLESSRPMWEMWFLTGLPDGQVAWFIKLHHTMGDGMAAMTTVAALLDSDPHAPRGTAPAWHRRRTPLASELVADNLRRRIEGLARLVTTLGRPGNSIRQALAAWPAAVSAPPGPKRLTSSRCS